METIDIILDLKKRMTDRQFQVFYMRTVKEMSFSAISDIVGVSPEAVRTAYANSIRSIKKLKHVYHLEGVL